VIWLPLVLDVVSGLLILLAAAIVCERLVRPGSPHPVGQPGDVSRGHLLLIALGAALATAGTLVRLYPEGKMLGWAAFAFEDSSSLRYDDFVEILRVIPQEVLIVPMVSVGPFAILCAIGMVCSTAGRVRSARALQYAVILPLWLLIVGSVGIGAANHLCIDRSMYDAARASAILGFLFFCGLCLVVFKGLAASPAKALLWLGTVPLATALVGSLCHFAYVVLEHRRFHEPSWGVVAITSVCLGTCMISLGWFGALRTDSPPPHVPHADT
jgi:hypothetical protein